MKYSLIPVAAAAALLTGCATDGAYISSGYPGYYSAAGYYNSTPYYSQQPAYIYSAPVYRGNARRGDRDRDHDGVPNRLDADRDGDGVPNRLDARPNNARRQ